MEGCSLLKDLHEQIKSPNSRSVYWDILIQIDEGKSFWTSKLAVFLLYPFLEVVLSSADVLILPSCISKKEEESIINVLKFEFHKTIDQIPKPSGDAFTEHEEQTIESEPRSNVNQNQEITIGSEVQQLNRFSCPECPSTFSNKRDLKKHSVKHSEESHECQVCGRRIKDRKNFNRHISLHGADKNLYKCKFCDKAFNRRDNYKRHMTTRHSFVVF